MLLHSNACNTKLLTTFNNNHRLLSLNGGRHWLESCCRSSFRCGSPSLSKTFRISRGFIVRGSFWQALAMAAQGNLFSAFARPKSPINEVLKNVEWPEKFPFKEEDFQRFDESSDSLFYSTPRFVTHIDDPAIAALTKFYSAVFPPSNSPGVCLLDLCSSWVSHYPKGYKQDKIVGLGMNEEELQRNPVLTDYVVQDLNVNPKLPFGDNSFDAITNAVSVDYLNKPIDVFKEMQRVLKPGGLAIMSFSNRCFWTKAISIWTSTGDVDHVWIVGAYFHYAGGFDPPEALDISPNPGRSDPMKRRKREIILKRGATHHFCGEM
ncbi:hypothetical protein AMTR_s00209p00028300 [Amborella trichopoda]|uniref:Methyltransferase type 11 domain-containing protein n=1 Tax=Amborella trichopoda TaxID=13333 RepID=W1PAM3_AMBTC|nr:hypothetical protein AMTR_s00209p00028300 [Amborella trichopoda]